MNGTNVTHSDLCQKNPNPACSTCFEMNILGYFLSPSDLCIGNEASVDATMATVNDNNILSKLNDAIDSPLNQIDISSILGGVTNDSSGYITGE